MNGYFRDIAFALTAIACASTAASAEKWSCEMELSDGKNSKHEWIVVGEKMFNPNGKTQWRVLLNDPNTLLAFLRYWSKEERKAYRLYVVLSKSTGVITEIDEFSDISFGPAPEASVPPIVTVGRCSLEQP